MATANNATLNVLSLCSGVGMLDEGVHAGLGHLGIRSRVLAYVERESYAAATLLARMEEQSLEPAPVWCGDLELLDCGLLAGRVDCVVAGFPCQTWSVAGAKAGIEDERWIWPSIMAIVRQVGAWLVVLENVPGLVSGGGLDPVLGALAEARFDAEWLTLAAAEVGAAHKRERVFILAVESERGWGRLRQSSGRDGFHDGRDAVVGDARLQHVELQQRACRAEHPRAGNWMGDPAGAARGQPGTSRPQWGHITT
jgi:DNA (cytosine-5)-methyltransferase 1